MDGVLLEEGGTGGFQVDQWKEQNDMEPAWALHEKYAGKTAEEKLKELRAEMKKEHTDMYVLTSLDDIAWLLNIRGNDIAYNPVVLSYVIVTEDKLYLFVNEEVLHKY